jgi:hypothetical protein
MQHIIQLILCSVLIFSCDSKVFHDREVDCKPTAYIFSGKIKRTMFPEFAGIKIVKVCEVVEGSNITKTMFYHYDKKDRLKKISLKPFANDLFYSYDTLGRLLNIKVSKLEKYCFFYDSHNRIERQVNELNNRVFQSFEFVYSGETPSEAIHYNQSGKAIKKFFFYYDTLLNPYYNLGQFINPYETIYGYPVGNHRFLLKRVVMIDLLKDNEQKKMEIVAKINEYGYVTEIDKNKVIEYNCYNAMGRWLNRKFNYDGDVVGNDW